MIALAPKGLTKVFFYSFPPKAWVSNSLFFTYSGYPFLLVIEDLSRFRSCSTRFQRSSVIKILLKVSSQLAETLEEIPESILLVPNLAVKR